MFRREGDYWLVIFDGNTVRVRDLKGMRYLARLLADHGREHHVLDLVAAEAGGGAPMADGQQADVPRSSFGEAGEILDSRAKGAYRRRLAEIDEDIEEAGANGDTERAAQTDAERDILVQGLSPRVWPRRAWPTSRLRVRAWPARGDSRCSSGHRSDR